MHSLSLFDKLWTKHVVHEVIDGPSLIYIDKHLINEVTSAQAFDGLRNAGLELWRSDSIIATADHNVPTVAREAGIIDPVSRTQVDTLSHNCATLKITYFGMTDLRQGILHVVAPEQGMTLPGTTVVCGDSHTSTHGAFAALAFGIGTSEVEQVLASQTLFMHKPKSIRICIEGERHLGVTAKDLALAVIRRIGTAGGTGSVIEFAGACVRALSMEARMTLCNMAIEAGARAGMIGVDDTTLSYLKGRPMSPAGAAWQQAEAYWRTLVSDPAARFDQELTLDAATVRPLVTWGTSPEMVVSIDELVPDPAHERDPVRRESMLRALTYMGLEPNTPIKGIMLDTIFIGSCTNSRLEDLRAAAAIVRGRRIAPTIGRALVVPGSGLVKRQAEAEGLDLVFIAAGFEWRDAGCSMCLGMNDDRLRAGERCASTSNRNFEGRQGPGGRTHLVSPQMAAAAAIAGHFTDVSHVNHPVKV